MQILMIYPSGTEHIEDVPTLDHARPIEGFGGDAFVIEDDGRRTPLADKLLAADIAQEAYDNHAQSAN